MSDAVIYTDGSCRKNPGGPGGWGVVMITEGDRRELFGGEQVTTSNRMEMLAAIRALEALPTRGMRVLIHTDSQYLRRGITQWIKKWKVNGWRTTQKTPVKNAELWRALDDLCAVHNVTWKWVKGHAGNPDNERADSLAKQGTALAGA